MAKLRSIHQVRPLLLFSQLLESSLQVRWPDHPASNFAAPTSEAEDAIEQSGGLGITGRPFNVNKRGKTATADAQKTNQRYRWRADVSVIDNGRLVNPIDYPSSGKVREGIVVLSCSRPYPSLCDKLLSVL